MSVLTSQPDGTAGKDSEMYAAQPDTNRGSDNYLAVGGSGTNAHRSVIQFDLSSIPANATINSAILSLFVQGDYSANARTIRAFRINRAWVEAEVTWNKATSSVSWTTAGCSNVSDDREGTDIGSASVGANPSVGDEIQITLDAAKVQEWVSGAFANNGLLLKVDTENSDEIDYNSSDHATANIRPKLVVTYTSSSVKKIAGVDYASTKKIIGVAIASAKKIAGVA